MHAHVWLGTSMQWLEHGFQPRLCSIDSFRGPRIVARRDAEGHMTLCDTSYAPRRRGRHPPWSGHYLDFFFSVAFRSSCRCTYSGTARRSQASASCVDFAARDTRDHAIQHRSCNWAAPLLQSCSSGANTTKIAGYQLLQAPTSTRGHVSGVGTWDEV